MTKPREEQLGAITVLDEDLTGIVDCNSARLTDVDTPTSGTDAANKAYVDAQIGAQDTLSEILANGNTTDGEYISVDDGYVEFGTTPASSGDIRLTDGGEITSAGEINLITEDVTSGAGSTGAVIIAAGDNTGTGGGGYISIDGGDTNNSSAGGGLNLNSGSSTSSGTGGALNINAGDSTSGWPGSTTITGGTGGLGGGHLNFNAGAATSSGTGGNANLIGGNGISGGGNASVTAGDASAGAGADVVLSSGSGSTEDGYIILKHGTTEIVRFGEGSSLMQFATGADAVINFPLSSGVGADLFIYGQDAPVPSAAGSITIISGQGSVGGPGGDVTINGGDGNSGGDLVLASGGCIANKAGDVYITTPTNAPASALGAGSITIESGFNSAGAEGDIDIIAGGSDASGAGSISLSIEDSSTSPGSVSISAGKGSTGGDLTITAGDAASSGVGGDITITAGGGAGNGLGGDLYLVSGLGAGDGEDGYIIFERGTTEVARFDDGGSSRFHLNAANSALHIGETYTSKFTYNEISFPIDGDATIKMEETGSSTNDLIIQGQDTPYGVGAPGNILLVPGNGETKSANGYVEIQHYEAAANFKMLKIYRGGLSFGALTATSNIDIEVDSPTSGAGLGINITAADAVGTGDVDGGSITLTCGEAPDSGDGGSITLNTGGTDSGETGSVIFQTTNATKLTLQGADGTLLFEDVSASTTPAANKFLIYSKDGEPTVRSDGAATDYGVALVLRVTDTEDVGSISAHTAATFTATVTGAASGDHVTITTPSLEDGLIATGYVSAGDTVTVKVTNTTDGAINPASQDYLIQVFHVPS